MTETELTLSNLKPKLGSKHKKKRIGCGEGSGHGGSGSTRGMKGQRARSGEGKNPGFEGGQMPLLRRIPKFGFSNKKFSVEYQTVAIEDILSKLSDNVEEVNIEVLKKLNLINSINKPVKVVVRNKKGKLKLDKKIKLCVHKCSKSVVDLLSSSGGEYVRVNS
jgi:large subunit ribosomal protein L15